MSVKLLSKYVQEPRVFYTPEMYRYIDNIVALCPEEVSWIGCGDRVNDFDWLINEIYVLPQECHSTETEFEDDAVADWCEDYLEMGGDTTRFILWGHSHVDMPTTPSAPDYKQADIYIKDCPEFICAIHNKDGDTRHDVYYRSQGIMFPECKSGVYVPEMEDAELADLVALLKTCVKKRTYTTKNVTYGYANAKLSPYQLTLWDKLPDKPGDTTVAALKLAGYRDPSAVFVKSGKDYLGSKLVDYQQYFIDEGRNGTAVDVRDWILGVDNVIGNVNGIVSSEYLWDDLDDEGEWLYERGVEG